MQRNIMIAGITLLTIGALQGPAELDAQTPPCVIEGQWRAEDESQEIEVYEADGEWFGRIVRSSAEDRQPGFVLLREFAYNEDEERYEGRLGTKRLIS